MVCSLKFTDIFAGLGGFHLALRDLGHICVFASEIDKTLRELYFRNFGIKAVGDIRTIDVSEIPEHEILCAGFPCQPFSKAGTQIGLKDHLLGGLYREILRVVRHHYPKYIILENVPNFRNHNNGKTWKRVKRKFEFEGYNVNIKKISPHHFGIPQIRERVYIVASTGSLEGFNWPEGPLLSNQNTIKDVLDKNPKNARHLSNQMKLCLKVWQEFLDNIPKEKFPHPLWSMEFDATYPYENTTPSRLSAKELRRYKGSYGVSLRNAKKKCDILELLPSHGRRNDRKFPDWKIKFIGKNREFYLQNKDWLDEWIPKVKKFPSSLQKLEWNCHGEKSRKIRKYIIQSRPSGVRIKRPTTAPSLVAMTATQVPIIGWENRYMTPNECKQLQSMDKLKYLPDSNNKAYEALGNAVNVEVAKSVAETLVGKCSSKRRRAL